MLKTDRVTGLSNFGTDHLFRIFYIIFLQFRINRSWCCDACDGKFDDIFTLSSCSTSPEHDASNLIEIGQAVMFPHPRAVNIVFNDAFYHNIGQNERRIPDDL